ncbi:arginine deiminase-related protein [Legionella worsleiensis]|uniref:Amidinotransferase n=1 Tax=Legionella worsleiensis TaxID=45076 RepID=A0A0W1AEU5_9GAMM|nr:arginine deiminase-related protein [Legionella worsleiensis]KTD79850.1 hypothetical protein Lwor_1364 [Legionella worsleiensis]STY32361.1 Uncharacterized protein conserved in bacteria containing a pentein-type domain [Legionella worsleiensis]
MHTPCSTVLMVPPQGFQFNTETAASNRFQSQKHSVSTKNNAMVEFNTMVLHLRELGIHVLILNQNHELPDAVFPNNWFSTHTDAAGRNLLIVYPMLTPNRQAEVNIDGLCHVLDEAHFTVNKLIDLRNKESLVLEGTGSLVLDRANQLIYAALSPRTSPVMVHRLAEILHYKPIIFNSIDAHGHPVYHTNVILSITEHYAIICLDSVKDPLEKSALLYSFTITGKQIIDITYEQTQHMCANVLELFNKKGRSILVMSAQAKNHFTESQLELIQNFSQLAIMDIKTIEHVGGGSVRCMMAEIVYQR